MNFQTLKDYFQEFIECNQHKIMFLNEKDDIFEDFKVIDAINFLEEKNKEIERLTTESTKWESKFYDEAKKVDEAIEYIEKNSYTTIEAIDDINYFIVRLDKCVDLLDILKGSDKE